MTYKIVSWEHWNGKMEEPPVENIYYLDAVDVNEAIAIFDQQVEKRQKVRPQIIEYITKLERLPRIYILT